jgi:hypothetical protein
MSPRDLLLAKKIARDFGRCSVVHMVALNDAATLLDADDRAAVVKHSAELLRGLGVDVQ